MNGASHSSSSNSFWHDAFLCPFYNHAIMSFLCEDRNAPFVALELRAHAAVYFRPRRGSSTGSIKVLLTMVPGLSLVNRAECHHGGAADIDRLQQCVYAMYFIEVDISQNERMDHWTRTNSDDSEQTVSTELSQRILGIHMLNV